MPKPRSPASPRGASTRAFVNGPTPPRARIPRRSACALPSLARFRRTPRPKLRTPIPKRPCAPRRELNPSALLVLLVQAHRLPQLDLVAVGIGDPGKAPVFVCLRTLDDRDAVAAQLRQQVVEVIHAVVDHEARLARTEPIAFLIRDVPDGEAAVLRLVLWPLQDRAAPRLEHQSQVARIPGSELLVIRPRLEEYAPDSGHSRHRLHHARSRRHREGPDCAHAPPRGLTPRRRATRHRALTTRA